MSDKKIKEREAADYNKAQETEKQPAGIVLIVEDVRMMRMGLDRVLKSGGYTVVEAENGIQALDALGLDTWS